MKTSAKIFLFTLMGFLMSFYGHGQEDKKSIRKGNQFYKEAKYEEAEQSYRQALDENSNSFEGAFNLGDAAYRQEKYEDAISCYLDISMFTDYRDVIPTVPEGYRDYHFVFDLIEKKVFFLLLLFSVC